MKRRLNRAAGLIHRPKLILMDEPTVRVDPQSRNRIFEMIETTHSMEEAERLCDRIAIVDHGRIIAMGSNEELVQRTFGSRSEVLAEFQGAPELSAEWVERREGHRVGDAAQFTIEHPAEIAGLLDDSAGAGLVLVDVSVRRPALESVFLQLTGRELRE